jgi:hypothetical protein
VNAWGLKCHGSGRSGGSESGRRIGVRRRA